MIQEIIVTTLNEDGSTHIAPMGIQEEKGTVEIAPFRPSLTLDNIQRTRSATVNRVDDVRIFAGCLTGHQDWPLVKTDNIVGQRLETALSHVELIVELFVDDAVRPRFYLRPVHEAIHAPFKGFNRAQAAVLEAAILVSRLELLPEDKINQELAYLMIAIDKTAGEYEHTAWAWLMDKVETFKREKDNSA